MKSISLSFLLAATGAAVAHEGQGLASATHWHASDLFGFALMLAVVGAAIWWTRRK